MKVLIALLCIAVVAVLSEPRKVELGGEITIERKEFGDATHSVTFFVTKEASYLGKIEVRAIRHIFFAFEDSSLWLCPGKLPCNNTGEPRFNYTIDVPLPSNEMTLYFIGSDINDLDDITIRACKGHCTDECKNECSGHGGCLMGLDICVCDTGRHNRGADCISTGWDWFNYFLLIGIVGFVLLVALIVGIICCCCCCICRNR